MKKRRGFDTLSTRRQSVRYLVPVCLVRLEGVGTVENQSVITQQAAKKHGTTEDETNVPS
jgi:hypothetical protein